MDPYSSTLVLTVFVLLYIAVVLFLRMTLKMPKSLLKIKDKEERAKRFSYYVSDVTTYTHVPVAILVTGYFLLTRPVTYGMENSWDEEILLLVKQF